jgi:hypothetical protein
LKTKTLFFLFLNFFCFSSFCRFSFSLNGGKVYFWMLLEGKKGSSRLCCWRETWNEHQGWKMGRDEDIACRLKDRIQRFKATFFVVVKLGCQKSWHRDWILFLYLYRGWQTVFNLLLCLHLQRHDNEPQVVHPEPHTKIDLARRLETLF